VAQLKFTSLFDNIEAHVEPLLPRFHLGVGTHAESRDLDLHEARVLLHGPSRKEAATQAIWCDVLAEAVTDPNPGGTAALYLVWFAIPRLRRTVWRILSRFPADRADLEAEAVNGVLEGIRDIDPSAAGEGERLMRAAAGRAWRFARSAASERIVPDPVEYAAKVPLPHESHLPSAWVVYITPPDRADGLAAPLRFSASKQRIEGERLGALAGGMGLRHVVHRARRPGPGRRIGTLSLTSYGSPR
jgi:hypothetical protein